MEFLSIGQRTASESRISVFLHGFPGLRSKQNRVIAERVSEQTGCRSDVLFYPGLSIAPGVFTFTECLCEVRAYFSELFAREPGLQVDLVGHSWGGFLSLVMAGELKARVRKMVLLSPLLHFWSHDIILESIVKYAEENPQLSLGEPESLAADFTRVGSSLPVKKLAADVSESTQVMILQAIDDPVTPTEYSRDLVTHFKRPLRYELYDNDHSFLSRRSELADYISIFLKD